MPKLFYVFCALFFVSLQPVLSIAEEEWNTFETDYTTLYYEQEEDLNSFFWRISGSEIDVHTYPGFAKSRVDRIIEKIQAVLDMYPEKFHVVIYIYPKYSIGQIAFYSEKTKSITTYADRVTDGILAHEVAHAVMRAYFKTPPPSKVAEILSQYVDRHLWSE